MKDYITNGIDGLGIIYLGEQKCALCWPSGSIYRPGSNLWYPPRVRSAVCTVQLESPARRSSAASRRQVAVSVSVQTYSIGYLPALPLARRYHLLDQSFWSNSRKRGAKEKEKRNLPVIDLWLCEFVVVEEVVDRGVVEHKAALKK